MEELQGGYDEAMFAFSQGDYAAAGEQLRRLLEAAPDYFEARLALGMVYFRLGDFAQAIAEGHRAEKLRPNEQLVHTNLSLFYQKSGDKKTAEHHGLQARIASWKADPSHKPSVPGEEPLPMAVPKPPSGPAVLPQMPWKKKPPVGGNAAEQK